jgi:hypothetical protein
VLRLWSWRASLIRKRAQLLGNVEVPTHEATEAWSISPRSSLWTRTLQQRLPVWAQW